MGDCCPSPDEPVIPLTKPLEMKRKALYALTWGEAFASFATGYIFGFEAGILRLVSVWIDYMGYATMHYCIILVMAFMGFTDGLMLLLNAQDGGQLQAAIYRCKETEIIFYILVAFSFAKCYACSRIQTDFRREFERIHGTSNHDDYQRNRHDPHNGEPHHGNLQNDPRFDPRHPAYQPDPRYGGPPYNYGYPPQGYDPRYGVDPHGQAYYPGMAPGARYDPRQAPRPAPVRPDPTRSQNVDATQPDQPVDEQQMHSTMTQEQIRYKLMQKKYEEHQRLMARVEERKQRLEEEKKQEEVKQIAEP